MTDIAALPSPTWMVGCGNMGQAIVEGWRSAGFDLASLTVIRPSGTPIVGVRTVKTPAEAGPAPKLVVLAVKPQKLDEVAGVLRQHLSAKTTLVSILAGVEIASLRDRFPGVQSIVLAMPNVAVAARRGVVALTGEKDDEAEKRAISSIFQPLGFAPWMVDEARYNAVGEISGAGPAYVARFVEALAKAGERRGLSAEMAAAVALETVFGTAWLASATGETMEAIANRVASPNGTTEAGLAVLDRDHVLDQLVAVTIDAAASRGDELARESRASLVEKATLH